MIQALGTNGGINTLEYSAGTCILGGDVCVYEVLNVIASNCACHRRAIPCALLSISQTNRCEKMSRITKRLNSAYKIAGSILAFFLLLVGGW